MTPSDGVAIRSQLAESNVLLMAQYKRLSIPKDPQDEEHFRYTWEIGLVETEMLLRGDLFVWTSQMWSHVIQAAKTMPTPVTFRKQLQPAVSGLYLFDKPFTRDGISTPIHGLGWHQLSQNYTAMFLYGQDDSPSKTRRKAPLDVIANYLMREGANVSGPEMDEQHVDQRKYTKDRADFHAMAEMTWPLMASWLWLKQRILTFQKESVTKAARKLAERAKVLPSVHTVVLRRSETMAHEPGNGTVEWSCQWLVRGHWRQQYYPSTGDHCPIWIEPFIKGPEDKPLRVAPETVYAVTR